MTKLFKIKRVDIKKWMPDHDEVLASFPISLADEGPEYAIYDALFEQVARQFPGQFHKEPTFEDAKVERYAAIDRRTKELIEKGMPFAGKIYSLTEVAQLNYAGMLVAEARGFMQYPITFNTLDDQASITISTAQELDQFCGTAMYVVALHKGSGTALKKRVLEAVDWEALNAIVDDRADITASPGPSEPPPPEDPPEEEPPLEG